MLTARHCPDVSIVAMAQNVSEGIGLIDQHQPDVVFLDIEMPMGSGFRLLEHYRHNAPFEVIFTTTFDHYAIKAFRYAAIDYLLKPINHEELQKAIDKVRSKKIAEAYAQYNRRVETLLDNVTAASPNSSKLALPTMDGYTFVKLADIIRFEAEGNYTKVYLCTKESVLISRILKEFEDVLPEFFIRIHKSHIINMNFIKKYSRHQGMVVMEDGSSIDVAVRKKDTFLEKLNRL